MGQAGELQRWQQGGIICSVASGVRWSSPPSAGWRTAPIGVFCCTVSAKWLCSCTRTTSVHPYSERSHHAKPPPENKNDAIKSASFSWVVSMVLCVRGNVCLENIDKNTSDAINAEGFTDIDLGEHLSLPCGLLVQQHCGSCPLTPGLPVCPGSVC